MEPTPTVGGEEVVGKTVDEGAALPLFQNLPAGCSGDGVVD